MSINFNNLQINSLISHFQYNPNSRLSEVREHHVSAGQPLIIHCIDNGYIETASSLDRLDALRDMKYQFISTGGGNGKLIGISQFDDMKFVATKKGIRKVISDIGFNGLWENYSAYFRLGL